MERQHGSSGRTPLGLIAGLLTTLLFGCSDQVEPSHQDTPAASTLTITLADTSGVLRVGDTVAATANIVAEALGARLRPEVTWSSSDSTVLSVVSASVRSSRQSQARFRAGAAGKATIVAAMPTGAHDTITLAVLMPAQTTAAVSTTIYPGQSVQAAVNAYPGGTTFTLKSGIHRLQSIQPKDGDVFVGESGAILSGARLLTTFTRSGTYWVASGQTQQGPVVGVCQATYPGCKYPEELFMDDRLLTHVTSLGAVAPGKWFFDYAADKIYFVDNPTGRRVETSVSPYAFAGSARNIGIRGLVIEKYAAASQMAAVIGTNTNAWIFEGNQVRWNHGAGVAAGSGWQVLRNNVHHNGQVGIKAAGAASLIVDGNEIAYNNTDGFDFYWEAGGGKFLRTTNLAVRNNYVHHNNGMGLWTDTSYPTTTYEYNRVTDNSHGGIYHEVSYDAVIRYNTCERNGVNKLGALRYAGIAVDNSPNVQIYGNTLTNNRDGIGARQVTHPTTTGPYGPLQVKNLYVHDNKVTMNLTGGYTGLVQYVNDNSYYTSRNNRFVHNTYYLGSAPQYFHWYGSARTEAQWRGYGQDVTGTFYR